MVGPWQGLWPVATPRLQAPSFKNCHGSGTLSSKHACAVTQSYFQGVSARALPRLSQQPGHIATNPGHKRNTASSGEGNRSINLVVSKAAAVLVGWFAGCAHVSQRLRSSRFMHEAGAPRMARQCQQGQSSQRPRIPKNVVRVLSGLVLGEIMGSATFSGGWHFCFAYSAVVYLISLEYSNILNRVLRPPIVPILSQALSAVAVCIVLAAHQGVLTGIFECAAVTMLLLLLVLQGNSRQKGDLLPINFSHIASQVFGVFYVGYLPAFWVRLRAISLDLPGPPAAWLFHLTRLLHWQCQPTVGLCVTTSLVLCIVSADTCAFIGGRTWGRRPLILISPKKTVEGAWCGLIGSVCMALLCDATWGFPNDARVAALVGAVIFAASLLGDLVASAMKRDAGLKDASSMVPGHGGLLDRFDSYVFSCPMVYFCWYFFIRLHGSSLAP